MKKQFIDAIITAAFVLLSAVSANAWQGDGTATAVSPASGSADNSQPVQSPRPELSREGWRYKIVLLKANWCNLSERENILKDIKTTCTAEQFERLKSLDTDPLSLGPSIAFGRPGLVARFTSAKSLGQQIAWLHQNGLIKDWINSNKIDNGVLLDIPAIRSMAENRPESRLVWNVSLIQDDVSASYVKYPFRRLKINRVLGFETEPNVKAGESMDYLDVTNLEIGGESATVAPEAFVTHFFSLQRDAAIRAQLAEAADVVAFLIVYPDRPEFTRLLNSKTNEYAASPKYHFKLGDISMPVDLDTRIGILRQEFENLELAVHAGTESKTVLGANEEEHQRELRQLAEKSFDLRQQLQRLELQRLKLKVQEIENNLAIREKSRASIIDRRLEDLIESLRSPKPMSPDRGDGKEDQ